MNWKTKNSNNKKHALPADAEGMFLHVTVPQRIRANGSEISEKQVGHKNLTNL
jgi:hypothetical protein